MHVNTSVDILLDVLTDCSVGVFLEPVYRCTQNRYFVQVNAQADILRAPRKNESVQT